MLKDVLKNLKQHCMSGISYMIPVIVIGGFCTALARLAGNVDTAGTIGYAFLQAGNAAFALMMSVLCAGIAYSICVNAARGGPKTNMINSVAIIPDITG